VLALGTACTPLVHRSAGSSDASSTWNLTLSTARNHAATGDFDGADSALARYGRLNSSTPSSLEATYWRALFKMDPANRSASLPEAMASLDQYLADTRPRDHIPEAATLRRLAGQLDGLNKVTASALEKAKDAQATAATANAAANDANNAARDAVNKAAESTTPVPTAEEVKRLKDELAKANAELDRIRKRLSTPAKPL
jgi:hypothetical protein